MRQFKPDPQRRIDIAGVPAPVSRPVDIDRSHTGFTRLRSLRIYRFEAGSVIDGHAEEDEVLIVVLAGSIELTLMAAHSSETAEAVTLTAADAPDQPCAAYLPPHGAYRLVAKGACDVAYARATPESGPPPAVFRSKFGLQQADAAILLEEMSYPRQLRVRLMQIEAQEHDMVVRPLREEEAGSEALLHIRIEPAERVATLTTDGAAAMALTSWDSVAIAPGERPSLKVAIDSSALILGVLAG